MSEKMFVTVWGLQEAEIKAHCFGACKKAIFSLLMDEQIGALSRCFEATCPFLDAEIDEPLGQVEGASVHLRKLKAVDWKGD